MTGATGNKKRVWWVLEKPARIQHNQSPKSQKYIFHFSFFHSRQEQETQEIRKEDKTIPARPTAGHKAAD
jgi:hypothetical protein